MDVDHEQPTITQRDRDAAAEMWALLGKVQFVHWQANWMRDGTADHGPVVQAFAPFLTAKAMEARNPMTETPEQGER